MKRSFLPIFKINQWLTLLSCLFFIGLANADSLESVKTHFESKVSFINQSLKANQKAFEASPELLATFVDQNLLPLWEASKTLTGLLGGANWNALSPFDQEKLMVGFNDTIQRYVQEGFALYDGQTLEFVSVKLNEQGSRGMLTVRIIPNVMPSFDVDFKIFKNQENWQLYDILVQGVSYVSLKKDSYRKQLSEQGIAGVLATINEKNVGYIASNINQGVQVGDKK